MDLIDQILGIEGKVGTDIGEAKVDQKIEISLNQVPMVENQGLCHLKEVTQMKKNEKCKTCSCWHPPIKCPFYPDGVSTACRTCKGLHRSHMCAYRGVKEKCLSRWGRFKKHGKTSLNTIGMHLTRSSHSQSPPNDITLDSSDRCQSEESIDRDDQSEIFYSSSDNEDLWEEDCF